MKINKRKFLVHYLHIGNATAKKLVVTIGLILSLLLVGNIWSTYSQKNDILEINYSKSTIKVEGTIFTENPPGSTVDNNYYLINNIGKILQLVSNEDITNFNGAVVLVEGTLLNEPNSNGHQVLIVSDITKLSERK